MARRQSASELIERLSREKRAAVERLAGQALAGQG
jgi:hypothetical protein